MQRAVVDVHHWMSAQEFSALFALAQAAPGLEYGDRTADWLAGRWSGIVGLLAGEVHPSSIVTLIGGWKRYKDRPWRRLSSAGWCRSPSGWWCRADR